MSYAHPHRYAWGNFAIDADERAHPHTSVPEPPVKNDQVVQRGDSAGSEYGRIAPLYGKIDPTQKSKLINYDYRPYEQQIDDAVAEHGYSVYYAGGKYGRPDLENKNYNTGHLMVYDPTPGQGGDFDDEAQTRSWRKIHELSHALAYKQLNEKYGEGRRIGKLGVDEREFARETNTVMHDAVHRAITGKFTNPDEEGFIPSDQIVPLEVSLGYLEQAARAMGLKGEDDTLKKRGEYWVQVFEESADPDEPFDAATIDQVEDTFVESLDEVVDIAEEHGMAAGNLYPPSTGTWFHTDPWEDEEGVERQRDMMVARPDGAHLDESDHEELDHRITGATQVSDSFAVSLLRPLVDVGSEGHLYVAVREELASILDKVPNLSPEESKIVSAVRTVGSFVEGAGKRFGEFVIRADEDDEEDLVERVKRALTPDLRKGRWKTLADDCDPMTGHCYVASEALRSLLGPEWRPMFIEHEGSPHWFLKHEDGRILDVTSSQFSSPVPYDKAKGKGFLTREPSARARTVLERVRRAQFDGSEIIPEPKRKKVPLDELLQSEVDRDLSAYEDSGEGLQNIVRVLSLATPAEIEYWSEWYPMAKKNVEHLATEYGLPFDVTAAVVAVLSPGNKWGLNLRAAAEVIENSTRTNAYPRNVEKARQILATEDVSLLTGPKVKTFFQSLVDPESVARDVVLDGHAMNIWRGEKRNLKGLSRPTKAEREAMLRDYARAAEVFGLTPQAVQAITWYIWKSVTKTARSRHKHDKFKGEVYYGYVAGRDGDITHFASGYATKPIQLKPNAKVIRCADNMSLEDALVTAAQQSADAVRFGKAMYVLNKDAAVEPAKGLDWALVEVLC
jgi:hypothetical protein